MTRYLTVAELAAILGMSPSGVRNVISRHQVRRRGRGDHGAGLYDPHEVVRHAGSQDRLAQRV